MAAVSKIAARWTHYGYWSDDGLTVLNNYGGVVYKVPGLIPTPSRPVLARQNTSIALSARSAQRVTSTECSVSALDQPAPA